MLNKTHNWIDLLATEDKEREPGNGEAIMLKSRSLGHQPLRAISTPKNSWSKIPCRMIDLIELIPDCLCYPCKTSSDNLKDIVRGILNLPKTRNGIKPEWQ